MSGRGLSHAVWSHPEPPPESALAPQDPAGKEPCWRTQQQGQRAISSPGLELVFPAKSPRRTGQKCPAGTPDSPCTPLNSTEFWCSHPELHLGVTDQDELGCPHSLLPLAVPSCDQRKSSRFISKCFNRNYFSTSQILLPPPSTPCVHTKEEGTSRTYIFLYFLFTSHLLLQYYSWPGSIQLP